MTVYPIRRADLYFTVTQFQFRALHQGFEMVEHNSAEMIERRGYPSWNGRPETSGHAVKEQLHQSLVDDMMPQAFRASVLIGLWGIFESALIVIDGTIRNLRRTEAALPQGPRFLKAASAHFSAELGIPLFRSSAAEAEAVYFQKLRHVLSHANGLREATKPGDWRFLSQSCKKYPGIDLDRGFVELSAQFVRNRFEFMAGLLEHVINVARNKLEALNAP